MKEWLNETHGPWFELLRHFLRRFFDNDLITTPDQMLTVLAGAVPFFIQWFFLLMGPLKHKYEYLSRLTQSQPYLDAVRADELWLITLMMSVIGLLTALKWQSLFPDLRDYRVLGTLPLKARQIFGAKLVVLLFVATVALLMVNLMPTMTFPALSSGRWAQAPLMIRIRAYAGASLAGCAFFFFALIALQGVLLNVLRPRAFGRVSANVQGAAVALMLALLVMSFSIQPQVTNTLLQAGYARYIPPVWFLGLCQSLSGDSNPVMYVLARRAVISLVTAVLLALVTYSVSYRRHCTLLMEGNAKQREGRRSAGRLVGWLVKDPREVAVLDFLTKTLTRSSYHRMLLMAYGGVGFAVILTGLEGMAAWIEPQRVAVAQFIYYHIVVLMLMLIGARHLFSMPVELKANWMFQVTENEGSEAWLLAVDRFVLFWGGMLLLAIPLPLELRLVGWLGIAEAGLCLVLGLVAYEWLFSDWAKLPFTCSHLPGKTRMPVLAIRFFGLIALVPILHGLLLTILYDGLKYLVVLGALSAAWTYVHGIRRPGWTGLRLKYDELPEPAVDALNLLK